MTDTPQQTPEQKILENITNAAAAYEIDGEKVTQKDPLKQAQALAELRALHAARNPLAAVRSFRLMGSRGDR